MRKIILFLLFGASIFAQEFKLVGDTTDLKTLVWNRPVLLLQFGGGTFDRTGGGIFQVIDSTYTEGTHAFDHPWSGKQWVRIQYLGDEQGAFTDLSADELTLTEDLSVGEDVFTTTAETDTVVITGAVATDTYIVCGEYTAGVDQQDVLQWEAILGKLVVHRLASGESALKYSWLRIKNQ